MEATRRFLQAMGLPTGDLHSLPSSTKRFPDGAQYRVEIPSTEGPDALAAIIESGPIPAVHGVVRWRIVDLCQ